MRGARRTSFTWANGKVQDVVDAVMFLESAGFVTGETLYVDDGQSAGH
uniref:Short-chain dehydrogenase/reductase n=1 Tax=Bradyrhizobium sp. JS329 TaxID=722413 RepID=F8QQ78_9BRAD|nr:short-chain dehydrogenase/reductase [Bradyrhizobium sp. JS329]